MAGATYIWVVRFFVFHGFINLLFINRSFSFVSGSSSSSSSSSTEEDFSILDFDFDESDDLFGRDYSPPSPPPPPPPSHPPSVSCEDDLNGLGSFNTSCHLTTSLVLKGDVYIQGVGSFLILPGVSLSCPVSGCSITVNISGDFSLGQNASIVSGEFTLQASNATLADWSTINTTALAGTPPAQTSGTPQGVDGAGGGHGGRGAFCLTDESKLPEDIWGGDTYSWSSLDSPSSYGSKGGTSSKEEDYGGGGGGRIWMEIGELLDVNGTLLAEGGNGGYKGGGGSGGSIYIKVRKM